MKTEKETMISKAVCNYFAKENITVTSETDGNRRIYTLSWTSPAGQEVFIHAYADRIFGLSVYAADEAMASALEHAYDDYDASQEAYYWLGSDGHGKNGAPYEMGDVYADFSSIETASINCRAAYWQPSKKRGGANMKINGITVVSNGYFAYDGCHKIYICEDMKDVREAKKNDYCILPLFDIWKTWCNSCELRFVRNWKLNKLYVAQCDDMTVAA